METDAQNNESEIETSALLQLIAMGDQELAQGQYQNTHEFFIEIGSQLDA